MVSRAHAAPSRVLCDWQLKGPAHQQVGHHALQPGVVIAHLRRLAQERHCPRLHKQMARSTLSITLPVYPCFSEHWEYAQGCSALHRLRQGHSHAASSSRGCWSGGSIAAPCLGFLQLGAAHERAQQDCQQGHAAGLLLPAQGGRQIKVRVPRPSAAPLLQHGTHITSLRVCFFWV